MTDHRSFDFGDHLNSTGLAQGVVRLRLSALGRLATFRGDAKIQLLAGRSGHATIVLDR
jgi:hypothetical protein